MLERLRLKNIALIDEVEIAFTAGLNIISGETGAGKTILIQAINYLLGQKGDSGVIRKDSDRALIEGIFYANHITPLLQEGGIEPDELLIIKRELNKNGKNRCFINAQPVPLSFLQKIGAALFELISQNAQTLLREPEYQLQILDTYGNHDLTPLNDANAHLVKLKKQLHEYENYEFKAWQLTELQELGLTDGEEEALFSEYKALSESQDRGEKLTTALSTLSDDYTAHLIACEKITTSLNLKDASEHLRTAITNLNEASYLLHAAIDKIECAPARILELETRLSKIESLKKKHGPDLLAKQAELESAIPPYSKEELFEEIESAKARQVAYANALQKERESTAKKLSKAVTKEIQELNMKGANFLINTDFTFSLAANPGEAPASLKEKTSGGELSRLLFAIKLLLKEAIPTLIFDEIDANIGGETATLFAKKLSALSSSRQILCITHFPQVARHADHHLLVAKSHQKGRTQVLINSLTPSQKEVELLRMLGGEAVANPQLKR